MNIEHFPEANAELVGNGSDIEDLPVHMTETQIISCWKPSKKELKEINKTGQVWLSVLSSHSSPPVYITGISPFKE